ncbi:hypothetical protein [Thermococcus sp. 2319x1]|nr:hypothetical protein [Thermococcus sp. 2319x1]
MKKLEENEVDEAKIVLKEGNAMLVLKVEDVISIRFVFGDAHSVIEMSG